MKGFLFILILAGLTSRAHADENSLKVCFETRDNRCFEVSREGHAVAVRAHGRVQATKKIAQDEIEKIERAFSEILEIPASDDPEAVFNCKTPVRVVRGKSSSEHCFFRMSNRNQHKISNWIGLITSNL